MPEANHEDSKTSFTFTDNFMHE